jgi:cytochrome c oxidase assembly protein Cox11
MHPLIRFLLRCSLIVVAVLVVSRPYNWYCNLNQSCKPFYFSYYIPKQEGTKSIEVSMEVSNYREDLDFSVMDQMIMTVANRKNVAVYHAKNISDHVIRFQPDLYFSPPMFEKFVKRYQCLCFHQYKLNPGESIDLKMEFEIDPAIESAEIRNPKNSSDIVSTNSYGQKIISMKIGYKVK